MSTTCDGVPTEPCEPCVIRTAKRVVLEDEYTISEPGYVSLTHMATTYTFCNDDSFSFNTGSCVSCRPGESPNTEHLVCECDAEFSRNGDRNLCEWCSTLTFKSRPADEVCLPCSNNSLSSEGGNRHIGCCCCACHFSNAPTFDCPICAIGTYEGDISNERCTVCAFGVITLVSGNLSDEILYQHSA